MDSSTRRVTVLDEGGPNSVNVVREDPVRRGLLFAGTERGAFVSFDDGNDWQPLANGRPATSVRDITMHGDDVVIATHGRAFYVLDDIVPLRALVADPAGSTRLFPLATAVRLPLAWLLTRGVGLGLTGAWLAVRAAPSVRGLLLTGRCASGRWARGGGGRGRLLGGRRHGNRRIFLARLYRLARLMRWCCGRGIGRRRLFRRSCGRRRRGRGMRRSGRGHDGRGDGAAIPAELSQETERMTGRRPSEDAAGDRQRIARVCGIRETAALA